MDILRVYIGKSSFYKLLFEFLCLYVGDSLSLSRKYILHYRFFLLIDFLKLINLLVIVCLIKNLNYLRYMPFKLLKFKRRELRGSIQNHYFLTLSLLKLFNSLLNVIKHLICKPSMYSTFINSLKLR